MAKDPLLQECSERGGILTLSPEAVHYGIWVGITECHPADELLIGRHAEVFGDCIVIVAERCLRTGLEAMTACR